MSDDLDDMDAMAAERLKTANEVDNRIETIDNKTRGLPDILESALDTVRRADNVQGPIREIKAGGVDGAQVIWIQFSILLLNSYLSSC